MIGGISEGNFENVSSIKLSFENMDSCSKLSKALQFD